jgi:hypothetical protein
MKGEADLLLEFESFGFVALKNAKFFDCAAGSRARWSGPTKTMPSALSLHSIERFL